jgi:NurA-like 5'-3' nuclease
MSETLETVAVKYEVLRKKLAKLLEEHRVQDKLEKGWFRLSGDEPCLDVAGRPPIVLSAVDGGNNKRSFLSFDLYVIKASAQGFTLGINGSLRRAFSKKIVDVDVIIPTEGSGDRLTLYRQVAETKMLYYSLTRSSLVLGDGSVESLVTRPIHAKLDLLDMEGGGEIHVDCEELEKMVLRDIDENPYQAMSVKSIVEEVSMDKSLGQDKAWRRILYLEILEKAVVLKLLFDKILNSSSLMVFLTKTGRSRRFFNAPVSDQYVLSVMTREAGYYLNSDVSFNKPREMIKELPRKCGLRELVERLTFVRGLVRLDNNAPVIGMEVIYNADRIPYSQREVFTGVLGILRLISPGGYPQPLYIVDRDTHIDNKEVEEVALALGLSMAPTGREVLEYE